MSFMNKLKNAVNSLTGGGAKVLVTAENPSLSAPFRVKVKVTVGDQDVQINRAYVRLDGLESVVLRNVRDGDFTHDVHENVNTFEQEFEIAPAQTLTANQEYEWEMQVEFPSNAPPPYNGRNATHELRILAGLDTRGNDPDSGWNVLMI